MVGTWLGEVLLQEMDRNGVFPYHLGVVFVVDQIFLVNPGQNKRTEELVLVDFTDQMQIL